MNFDYSDEQQQLADSLQKYLTQNYSFEQRKAILNSASGVSAAVWTTFAEMGLTSIALPEADGGFGGGGRGRRGRGEKRPEARHDESTAEGRAVRRHRLDLHWNDWNGCAPREARYSTSFMIRQP